MDKLRKFINIAEVKSLIKSKNLPDRLLVSSETLTFTLERNGKMFKLSVKSSEDSNFTIDPFSEFDILKFAEHGNWYHMLDYIEKMDGKISSVLKQNLPPDDFTRSLQWLVTKYLVSNELNHFISDDPNDDISYFDYEKITFKQQPYSISTAPSEVKSAFTKNYS